MIRAETSTGVLQNALAAFKLRSEVAESLTGVLQNAFPIPQASQRFGRIVDRGAPTCACGFFGFAAKSSHRPQGLKLILGGYTMLRCCTMPSRGQLDPNMTPNMALSWTARGAVRPVFYDGFLTLYVSLLYRFEKA